MRTTNPTTRISPVRKSGTSQWFDVSKEGLAKLREDTPKSTLLYELVQNALDTNAADIQVEVSKVRGDVHRITVRDDDPHGFVDLTHAYTLFAESLKKTDPTKRGRFNIGEKLVLALCIEASITTTKGQVTFDSRGRHTSKKCTESGTVFDGIIRLKVTEVAEMERGIRSILVPRKVLLTYNGEQIGSRESLTSFESTLPTLIAGDDGVMRDTERKTRVDVVEVVGDEVAMIYEMGIPVVETGDRWHVNVNQKVPLTIDRTNVRPAYLRKLRAAVLNNTYAYIDQDSANATWVRDAASSPLASSEAVQAVVVARYGDDAVIYDPHDREANSRAVAEGCTLIYGGSLSRGEWDNVKRYGVAQPAGTVYPTPHPGMNFDGEPLPETAITPAMRRIATYTEALAVRLLQRPVSVGFVKDKTMRYTACYARARRAGCSEFHYNLAYLSKSWFEQGPCKAVNDLIIHEFGHEIESNHLSMEFQKALSKLGAAMVDLALREPDFFKGHGWH